MCDDPVNPPLICVNCGEVCAFTFKRTEHFGEAALLLHSSQYSHRKTMPDRWVNRTFWSARPCFFA